MGQSVSPPVGARLVALGRRGGPCELTAPTQIRRVTTWAQNQGLTIVAPFGAPSSRARQHPTEGQLLAAAARHAFDVVGVTDLSRLGRSAGDVHRILSKLSELEIGVVELDTRSPAQDLLLSVALAARLEGTFDRERRHARRTRRRCPPKVSIDLGVVDRMQAGGATLTDIAWRLCVGRATLVRRLRRRRDELRTTPPALDLGTGSSP